MIPVPTGVQVWLATGHTNIRKGFDGLAPMVQNAPRMAGNYEGERPGSLRSGSAAR
jgi:hypothetical protein